MLWVLTCTVRLTVYSYHVTYAFQGEFLLYSCLNVKELLAQSRRETYSQMHRTDKYSQHSSIIWPVWPNGWVFVYELSGCGFESSWSHLNFRFRACIEQGVPWHSGNYRVSIHSEARTWHDKSIQSNVPYR